jgi:hypothetical protein
MKSRVGEIEVLVVLLDREVGFGNRCRNGNGRLKEFDKEKVPQNRKRNGACTEAVGMRQGKGETIEELVWLAAAWESARSQKRQVKGK